MPPAVAALLLTGGASRRMGRDKAFLVVGGERLADRAARLLRLMADPVLEVGPGYSDLPRVLEAEPDRGPLAAMAAGGGALSAAAGAPAATLVLAVDMPLVDEPLLALLAAHPSDASVVPRDATGRLQPLCARYSAQALDCAAALVAAGARAMRDLLDAVPYTVIEPAEWRPAAGGAVDPFADLDTPADLERL